MTDYLGIAKVSDKLIEAISAGIGTLYRPRAIRNEANARAHERTVIGRVELQLEQEKNVQNLTFAANEKRQSLELDYELALRARDRLVATEIQRQLNVEAIADFAMHDLPNDVSNTNFDDDWIRTLFKYGQEVSNESMQRIWAKILQQEVAKPNSFSLRTLQTLSTSSAYDLEIFRKFCALCDAGGRVLCPPPSIDFKKMSNFNYLESYGLSSDKLRQLKGIGLIGEAEPFAGVKLYEGFSDSGNGIFFMKVPGGHVAFKSLVNKIDRFDFVFYALCLTSTGRQLFTLSNVVFDWTYMEKAAQFYDLTAVYKAD